MQGSHVRALVHDQTYRTTFRDLVQEHWPHAEVYDPFANHSTSVAYDIRHAREVFTKHVDMCGEFDLVIAFVPEASMGTAIEMWEAHTHGRTVITVTPLIHNWVVQLASDAVFQNLEEFTHALHTNVIDSILEQQKAM